MRAPSQDLLPPVHPGEILLEEYLRPLRLSQNALAKALGVPANRIGALVHGHRGITADSALRLARYFRTAPEFWMNLQTRYDLERARDAVDVSNILPRPGVPQLMP